MERDQFLYLAESRNALIPPLVEKGGYVPAELLPRASLDVLGKIFIRAVYADSLSKSRLNHLAEQAGNQKVMIYRNHNSDADTTTFRVAMTRLGYSTIADNLTTVAGLKMLERPQTNWPSKSEHVLYVGTPQDEDNLKNALDNPAYDAWQQSALQEYQAHLRALNRATRRTLKEQLTNGRIISFYPQAGRSKEVDYKMGRVDRRVGVNFMEHDTTYFPILCDGSEASFPKGALPKPHVFDVDLRVGEPFTSYQLHYWHNQTRKIDPTITAADIAMAKLVALKPSRATDEAGTYYKDILAKLDCIMKTPAALLSILRKSQGLNHL